MKYFLFLILFTSIFSCQKQDYDSLKKECYQDKFEVCNDLMVDTKAPRDVVDYGFEQIMIGCKAKYLDACLYLLKYYEDRNVDGKYDNDILKTHRQSCKIGHKPGCDYFEDKTGKRQLNIR